MPSNVEIIVGPSVEFEFTRRSIEAVLNASSSVAFGITAIAADGQTVDNLYDQHKLQKDCVVRAERVGETASLATVINHVLRKAPGRDVILLSSGSLVASGWLDTLIECRERFPHTATLCTFSNSAGIGGYPRPWVGNVPHTAEATNELARIFSAVNGQKLLELPEPHTTCLYLDREAIRIVGGFSESLPQELPVLVADWCQRASQQGLKHFLCAGLYVGAEETGPTKLTGGISALHSAQILGNEDPARPFRRLVDWERLCCSPKPRVLLITHRQGGGVERHVSDMASILSKVAEPILLRPNGEDAVSLEWARTGEDWRCWFQHQNDWNQLTACLKNLNVQRVHLHHVDGLPHDLWNLAGALEVPLDITLHDHWPITPSFHLYHGAEVKRQFGESDWQDLTGRLLASANRVFAPSKYLADTIHEVHPNVPIIIWPHPSKAQFSVAESVSPVVKVALLGRVSQEKGLGLLVRCAAYAQKEGLPIHFRIIGPPAEPVPTYPALPLDATGEYRDAHLAELIAIERPDVIFFPSQVPESFSYTLTTAIQSGLPIVASNLGALGERLKDYPNAILLPFNSEPADWCRPLLNFLPPQRATPEVVLSAGQDQALEKYLAVFSESRSANKVTGAGTNSAPPMVNYFPPSRGAPSQEMSLKDLYRFGVEAGHTEAKQELVRRLSEEDQQRMVLRAELDSSENRRRQLESTLAESMSLAEQDRARAQDLLAKREALELELRELHRQLTAARADHFAASNELLSKVHQLDIRNQQYFQFETALDEARKELQIKQGELEIRTGQYLATEAALREARAAFDEKSNEVEVRNRQFVDLEVAVAAAREAFESKTRELASAEALILDSHDRYNRLDNQFHQLQHSADEMRANNIELEEDNSELKTLLGEAEGSIKDLSISNRELALALVALQAKHDEAERFRVELQTANAEFARSIESKQTEANALQQTLRTLTADLDRERQKSEDFNRAVEKLNLHIKQLDAELIERQEKFTHVLHLTRDTLEGERDAARAAFAEISGSKFWRLTSPLRKFSHLLKQVLVRTDDVKNQTKGLPRRVSIATQILREEGPAALGRRVQDALNKRTLEPNLVGQCYEQETNFHALTVVSSARPKVSIVIPVYGQHLLTFTCLKSIAATCAEEQIEVIVIDDCSPEPAASALSMVSGIRHIRNDQNLGFLKNCNKAAAQAKGDYVLLLNNDVIVTPGWLEALLETFSQRTDVGMVGAKLIYPDGRLQEAGGIVWRDGSAWNWGRDQDASRPEFNYLREVDYCSGAVLILQRSFWNELGGFDERYAPAYYEDTDLAFRVRAAGKRVFYQPNAVVVHFEGQSSGTDVTQGIKRYQVVNQETFVGRWRTTLAKHRVNGQMPRLERDRYVAKRVLVIDACMLTPDQDSGSLRMFEMLGVLAKMNLKVTFFADNLEFKEPYVSQIQALGVEVIYHPVESYVTPLLERIAAEYDVIMLSRATVAVKHIDTVKRVAPQAKLIFDTVDLHFLRQEREAELADSAVQRAAAANMKEQELSIMAKSDLTIVVSPVEQKLLAEIKPGVNVRIVSNIHVTMPGEKSFKQRTGALFIGGFRHPPNLDAITWYVENVLPILRRKNSRIVTTVIGSNAPPSLQRFAAEDFIIAGFIEDLTPYYDNAKLSFSPLRYGAGVKGKVNIAMQYGVPVVATSPSIEGMHLRHELDVLRADTPEAFADAMIRLNTDQKLWGTLRASGLANIETHFSRSTARTALAEIIGISA